MVSVGAVCLSACAIIRTMFMHMLRAHIPRSLRAGVALVVMVAAYMISFNALSQIVTDATAMVWVKFLGGLIVGIPATICFYMFQAQDGSVKSWEQIQAETLAHAAEEKSHKQVVATPAYPGMDNPITQSQQKPTPEPPDASKNA